MERKLLVEEAFRRLRVALLEDGRLVEYRVEEDRAKNRAGSIYKAKVKNILPGMAAAFVDIGEEKNAYLAQKDLLGGDEKTIGQRIKPGDELLVQVLKESDGRKGARVTAKVSLPGRLVVLKPFEAGLGASKRMEDEQKRIHLKRALKERCPDGMGLVLRTAAQFEEEEALLRAVEMAIQTWEGIRRQASQRSAPCLLFSESDLLEKDLRDLMNENLKEIVISGKNAFDRAVEIAKNSAPDCADRLRLYQGEVPLFDLYNLEREVQAALHKRVELKKGGFLVIEQTEALTVVDVNTGAYVGRRDPEKTVLDTNLEAAEEIARQLRLRNIGGAIIVDFIDMNEQNHRKMLVETLKNACKSDRTPVLVHGITKLGLVEMTRRKSRQPLRYDLMQDCPLCHGEGSVFREEELLRKGLWEALRRNRPIFVRKDLLEAAEFLSEGSGVEVKEKAGLKQAWEIG